MIERQLRVMKFGGPEPGERRNQDHYVRTWDFRSNISVVIEAAAVRRALAALHSEFRLGALTPMPLIGVDLCKTYRQSVISI